MKVKSLFLCLLIVGLSLNSTAAAPINLLSNPGFETGDLTGWTVGGPNGGYGVLTDGSSIPGVTYVELLPAYQNVRSGTYAAYAVAAYAQMEYVMFSQVLNLLPGTYTASFYMGHDENHGIGISPAIGVGNLGIWIDQTLVPFNSFYENNFYPGSDPEDFTLFDADFFCSGGLTTIEFRISGSGTERAGISIDDLAVMAIPSPGAIYLACIGSALVGNMRRRKNI